MDQSQLSEPRRLFVGGLSRETDEETLGEHFSHYGTVEESLIIRDKYTGLSRGFGFIMFSTSSMAKEARKHENHVILGKKVEVKEAKPRTDEVEESNGHSNGTGGDHNTETNTKKIFVGGLPLDITREEFKSYFDSFGIITDAPLIHDKETGRSRGFGFITFDSEDAVNNVLQTRFHILKDKRVEVKRAYPRDRNSSKYQYCYYTNWFPVFYFYPCC